MQMERNAISIQANNKINATLFIDISLDKKKLIKKKEEM
jgi:hypothetical protein